MQMKVDVKTIQVPKTLVYSTNNPEIEMITELWYVLHGYGQLCEYFIEKFSSIDAPNRLIVAPQGLYRFYTQGQSGRVGATWMTSHRREEDIANIVTYLNVLDEEIVDKYKIGGKVNKVLFGFSQGVAAAVRWLTLGSKRFDRLVMYAGSLPHDLDYDAHARLINSTNPILAFGDSDAYFDEKSIEKLLDFLKLKGLEAQLYAFDGGHQIYPKALTEIQGKIGYFAGK